MWKQARAVLLVWLVVWGVNAAVPVPASLDDWQAWVLQTHPDLNCPLHDMQSDAQGMERRCGWPGRLMLDVQDAGVGFEQSWRLYAPGWVLLPGDSRYWPRDIRVNDQPAPVMDRQGRPALWLAAGDYLVQGALTWERRPTRLPVPLETALLSLRLDGQAQTATLDEAGNVLLGGTAPRGVEADALTVQVFRKLQDGIPLVWESELRLAVSGKDREIVLGPLLLPGSEVLQLDAPLPARLEPDGQLRMQVRAGEWVVRLKARVAGQVTQWSRPTSSGAWPADEVWVFAGDPALRQASLSGAPTVDPSQTRLPDAWRQLPAFLVRAGDTLTLTEQQRGDTSPAAADLAVQRTAWLDFDGQGYTFVDTLEGVLARSTRLSVAAGYELGRADVNGQPQLVTQLKEGASSGLELQQGPLLLTAVSRASGRGNTVSAVGWQQDVSQLKATVNAPPGWLLLHAVGADAAQGSWVAQWNLWGIFLVVVVAAAASRLWGVGAGIVALLAMVLSYQMADAPVMIWLYLLAGLGVLSVVPPGRLQHWLLLAVRVGFVVLVCLVLQFSVTQLRLALYPQLEMPWVDLRARAEPAAPAAASARLEESDGAEVARKSSESKAVLADRAMALASLPSPSPVAPLRTGYDPRALIQTGPGEPAWQWQQIELVWNGPVQAAQTLRLYWLSPVWHSLWRGAAVLCVLLFTAGLFKAGGSRLRVTWPQTPPSGVSAALLMGLLVASVGHSPVVQAADYPSAELLGELESRLSAAPDCAPTCAGIQAVRVLVQDDALQISLRVDTGTLVSVPLPVNLMRWQPRTVLVDGVATTALRREQDRLWLALPAGTHQLVLEGPLGVDSLQLPFALAAHNVTVVADGWQVSGVVEGRIPSGSLELRREQAAATVSTATSLLPDPAPVFVRVWRRVSLGMEWEVESRVERIAPLAEAIQLDVPLLTGESVLTPGVRAHDGVVSVSLGRDSHAFTWRSRLAQAPSMTLTAADGPWTETWAFAINPVWHAVFTGLPPVQQAAGASESVWQPWPGEQLVATVSRPQAVAGSTHTIESADMAVTPGARSTDVSLTVQLRSSQGSEWVLPLPVDSTLQQVQIDGVPQGVQLQQGQLRLMLHPGVQRIEVTWRQNEGVGWRTKTPALSLEEPANNIHLSLTVPQGRWLLWTTGPRIGPAVLVWGVVLVMLLVAVGLGRSQWAPVTTWQWALLGLGMSTVNMVGSLAVVLWFLFTAWRATQSPAALSRGAFNAMQVGLVLLTAVAAGCLLSTIPASLLSQPDMQVIGNGSSAQTLQWYQDKSAGVLPQGVLLSAPMLVYRVVMLLWSLWLVFALLRWCQWGWQAFSANGLWVPAPPKPPRTPPSRLVTPASPSSTEKAD